MHRSRTQWIAVCIGLLCAVPLIWQWRYFQRFYWLHDEWDMTSEWAAEGLAKWMWQPFAGESWFPLFKMLWAAAIYATNGSYFGMTLLLWATHLAIVLLLGTILLRSGFSLAAAGLAMITLGLSWSNMETLTWVMQWCHLLAVLFLLLAWNLLVTIAERPGIWRYVLVFLLAAASALSFSFGILTGPLLALFLWLRQHRPSGFGLALLLIAPALVLAHGHVSVLHDLTAEKLGSMLRYSLWCELLNPLYYLLPIPKRAPDLRAVLIAGSVKVAIIAAGLRIASAGQRRILWTLLVFDLGIAGLTGLGRQQYGLESTIASRYQYVPLLCFGPFLGLAMAWVRERAFFKPSLPKIAFAVLSVAWALNLTYPWARHIERWSRWRGVDVKRALDATPDDRRFGLPGITAGRARELIRLYNLH